MPSALFLPRQTDAVWFNWEAHHTVALVKSVGLLPFKFIAS